MKVFGFLFCFLVVPISASFYDELHVAMHSVQRGFGKLLSDVVVDVTDTVHCTISAVEHVLTINGLMRNKSTYANRCKQPPPPTVDNDEDALEKFLKTRDALEEQTYRDKAPKDIYTAISKVNKTLSHAFDDRDNQRKMETISNVLKDETEQLTKVSNVLRQELNSITRNVNSELQTFERDLGPSIWSEMEKDRNEHDNTADSSNQNLEKSNILSKNTEISKPSSSNAQNSFDAAQQEFEHFRDDIRESEDKFPKTFRDVARNIRNSNQNDDFRKPTKPRTGSVFDMDTGIFDQLSPFFNSEEHNENPKRAVAETVSIIKDSKQNEEIMNKLFSQDGAESDLFTMNSGIFNF